MTGLALNDVATILRGAIPSALLALTLHAAFEGLDRVVIRGHYVPRRHRVPSGASESSPFERRLCRRNPSWGES